MIRDYHADARQFLSTPSGWRATELYAVALEHKKFLSTPSGWRATWFFFCRGDHELESGAFCGAASADAVVAKDIFIRHHKAVLFAIVPDEFYLAIWAILCLIVR